MDSQVVASTPKAVKGQNGWEDEKIMRVYVSTDEAHFTFDICVSRENGTWYSNKLCSLDKPLGRLDSYATLAFMRASSIRSIWFSSSSAATPTVSLIAGRIAAAWKNESRNVSKISITFECTVNFRSFCSACKTDSDCCVFFLFGQAKRKLIFAECTRNVTTTPQIPPSTRLEFGRMTAPLHVSFTLEIPQDLIRTLEVLSLLNIKSINVRFVWNPSHAQSNIFGRFLSTCSCERFCFDDRAISAGPFLRNLADTSSVRSLKYTWSDGSTIGELRDASIIFSRFLYLEKIYMKYDTYDDDDGEMSDPMLIAALRGLYGLPCLTSIRFNYLGLTSVDYLETAILRFTAAHGTLKSFDIDNLEITQKVSNFTECGEILRRMARLATLSRFECDVGENWVRKLDRSMDLSLHFSMPISIGGNSTLLEGMLTIKNICRMEVFDEISYRNAVKMIDMVRPHSMGLCFNMKGKLDDHSWALKLADHDRLSSVSYKIVMPKDQAATEDHQYLSLYRFGSGLLKVANPCLQELHLYDWDRNKAKRTLEMTELIKEALKNSAVAEITSDIPPLHRLLPIRNKILETKSAQVALLPRLMNRAFIKPRYPYPDEKFCGLRETAIFLVLKTHFDQILKAKSNERDRNDSSEN